MWVSAFCQQTRALMVPSYRFGSVETHFSISVIRLLMQKKTAQGLV
jgi:hypothetical protein